MKIGIIGGTFNPIHNAHLLIAEMAREEYGLDRVIFITDGNPPHKSANVTAKQRFEMTHIAIADNSAFEEDDFEINRSEKSYTVNTLGYLKEKMNGRIFPISAPVFRISSTDIRNRVKNGQTVRYMLPENVRDYINKYHLYKENENDR